MRVILFLLFCGSCFAQSPDIRQIASQASKENLKIDLYYLAGDALEGRLMGSRGDSLTAVMVASVYKKESLAAPYENGRSYIQSIEATRFDDVTSLTINGKKYMESDGWALFPNLPVRLSGLKILLTDFTTLAAFRKAAPNMPLQDHAVFISDKFFSNYDTLDSLEALLKSRGAKMIAWTGKRMPRIIERKKRYDAIAHYAETPAFSEPPSVLPEVGLDAARMQELLRQDDIAFSEDYTFKIPGDKEYHELRATISLEKDRKRTAVRAPNVIGVLEGTDRAAPAVIFSAHHDHDGKVLGKIHYGAVDNASGTATLLEVARLMNLAAKKGIRPKRSIVFASYTGEERGLLGAYYYAEHPLYPIEKTFAVLNIDMLGRIDTLHVNSHNPDRNYAYILVKDTLHRGLRESLYKANKAVGLTLDTHYEQPQYEQRRIMGSDQFALYEKGVPFVRIDCGFAKEYHDAEDTPDKIDYDLLTRQTRLVFLTLWNMAND